MTPSITELLAGYDMLKTAVQTGMISAVEARSRMILFDFEPVTIVDCGDFRLCIVPDFG